MSTEWHLDPRLATRYVDGALTPAAAMSVESHLLVCSGCQQLLSPAIDAARLEAVWSQVRERVEAPPATHLERALRRAGVSDSTSRLLAITPSLRGGWFTGVLGVLVLSLLASRSGPHGVAVFLALAPLLPMIGVAFAFGPVADPSHDMVAAAPYDAFRLLAVRAVAVVVATLVLAVPAGLLLPGEPWLAVGWLLPALALAVVILAAAPRVQPVHTAAALALGWLFVALPALRRGTDPLLVTHAGIQLVSLLVLAVGAVVLVMRQQSLPAVSRRIS
jgi:hypothetical protein